MRSQQKQSFLWLAILSGASLLKPHHAEAAVTYGYDPLGRIATALYDNGACIAYTYDANGNLMSQTNFMPPQMSPPPQWNAVSWGSFTWNSGAQWPPWGEGAVWGCFQWTAQ